mgnify:CR=1 FL=1
MRICIFKEISETKEESASDLGEISEEQNGPYLKINAPLELKKVSNMKTLKIKKYSKKTKLIKPKIVRNC